MKVNINISFTIDTDDYRNTPSTKAGAKELVEMMLNLPEDYQIEVTEIDNGGRCHICGCFCDEH